MMKEETKSCMAVKTSLFFLLLIAAVSCESMAQITLIWESDTIASNPESIVYDQTSDCCYVSNFGSNPADGMNYNEDFITKFDLKGEVLEKRFIQNLTAPTGLCLHNDFLYIVERFGIVKRDLKNYKGAYREVLNTSKNETYCADFEYIDDQQLFIIPTLRNNKISVYKYNKAGQ
jgi:hypothetical protein